MHLVARSAFHRSLFATVAALAAVAALALLLWPQSATATPTAIGPMTVDVPSAWTPRLASTAALPSYFLPATHPPQQVVVTFSAAADGGAQPAAGHQALWNELVNLIGTPRTQRSGQLGRFLWSDMRVVNRQNGQEEWHRVYSTRHGDTRVALAVSANGEAAHGAALPVVEAMLSKAVFADAPASAQATAPASVAGGTGASAADVPIVEAHTHVEVRFGGTTSGVLTDHILFFGNGVVVREGVIDGRPRECYALYDVRQVANLPRNYGRWREDKGAGTVQIQWQEGPAWTLKRESGRLVRDGKKLLPYRPIDGARLDGVYQYTPVGDPPSQIELRPDGRFAALNLRERMGCPAQARPAALAGNGTYEVRRWTLILRFADGRITPLPMHVESDEDLKRIGKFWLNGHDFARVR